MMRLQPAVIVMKAIHGKRLNFRRHPDERIFPGVVSVDLPVPGGALETMVRRSGLAAYFSRCCGKGLNLLAKCHDNVLQRAAR